MGTSKLENQISINGWKPDLDNHMRIDFREIIKFSKPDYLVWRLLKAGISRGLKFINGILVRVHKFNNGILFDPRVLLWKPPF